MTHEKRTPVPPGGLADLHLVELTEQNRRLLERALLSAGGPPAWRGRKRAEARDLLALGQISGRLTVQYLDLREALRVAVLVRVPVPLLTPECPDLALADRVSGMRTSPPTACSRCAWGRACPPASARPSWC
jgi:hypothetical protein